MKRGKSPRNANFGNGYEGEMIPSIERIERWIKENMEVSSFEVEREKGEIVIWMKDSYFEDEDIKKLSKILKIRKWRIDGINCKVMLDVRGTERIEEEEERGGMKEQDIEDELLEEITRSVKVVDVGNVERKENEILINIIKHTFDSEDLRRIEEIAEKHNLKLSFFINPESHYFLLIHLSFREG
jgi:hypothetical protein